MMRKVDFIHKKIIWSMLLMLLIGFSTVLFGTSTVEAHASLLQTVPGEEVVAQPPSSVKLQFNEPIEYELATITVYDSNGQPILTANPEGEGERSKKLAVSLPGLEDGTYTVKWDIVSLDGHPVSGSYNFAVGKATEGGTKPVDSKDDSDMLLVIVRMLVEGLILLGAGVYWFTWLAEKKHYPGMATIFKKGHITIAIILIGGTLSELAAYAMSLPAGLPQTIMGGRWDLLLNFPFILMLFAQLFFLILLFIPGMMRGWYLFMWVILTTVPTFGGHVWGMGQPFIALIPRIFHQVAIAFWLGALYYLIVMLLRKRKQGKDVSINDFRSFFVPKMMMSSGLVIVTGIIMVYLQTGITAVFTQWGGWSTMLLVKILLTALMGSFALSQTLKWRKQKAFSTPRLLRVEWIVGLIVIFFGVWLSQTAYPIDIKSYGETLTSGQAEAKINIEKLQPGDQHMRIRIPTAKEEPESVTIEMSMPDHDMGSGPFTAEQTVDGDYEAEVDFTMSGSWEFVVHVVYPDGEEEKWSDSIFVPVSGGQ